MIAVVDYGAGNLQSVANALDAAGAQYRMVRFPADVASASKIILPGVGHFGQMMRALDELDLGRVLIERIRAGVEFLGICLGMQALFEGSEEAPGVNGLGIFPGRVQRFPPDLRVPHMGWNQVRPIAGTRLFRHFEDEPESADPWFYFAHSYYVPETEVTAGRCTYSLTYAAAVELDNIMGIQFHPEKSSAPGQLLLSSFLAQ
jgi:imidazole glycerol phosphate synthase glutamine amidotransferase subunit